MFEWDATWNKLGTYITQSNQIDTYLLVAMHDDSKPWITLIASKGCLLISSLCAQSNVWSVSKENDKMNSFFDGGKGLVFQKVHLSTILALSKASRQQALCLF